MKQKGITYLLFICAMTIWAVQANAGRDSVYRAYPCVEEIGHTAYLLPFVPADSVCETPSTCVPPAVHKDLSKGDVKLLAKLLLLNPNQPETNLPGYCDADHRPDIRISGSLILCFIRRLNI